MIEISEKYEFFHNFTIILERMHKITSDLNLSIILSSCFEEKAMEIERNWNFQPKTTNFNEINGFKEEIVDLKDKKDLIIRNLVVLLVSKELYCSFKNINIKIEEIYSEFKKKNFETEESNTFFIFFKGKQWFFIYFI